MRRLRSSWKPAWEFDFSVRVSTHVVTAMPGGSIAVPAMVELVRGEPQPVKLIVATNWASAGLAAQIIPPTVVPGAMSMAVLHITVSPNTPPGSYMLAVRGETRGTFKTSEDMVTVVVKPRDQPPRRDEDPPQNPARAPPKASKGPPARPSYSSSKSRPRPKPGRSPRRAMASRLAGGAFMGIIMSIVIYAAVSSSFSSAGNVGVNSNSSVSFEGTYNAIVTTVTPAGTTSGPGTFTVTNGYVSDPGGTFTGTVDANGNFTGTTIVSQGGLPMSMAGTFSLTGSFTIYGSSGSVSQTIVAHKVM